MKSFILLLASSFLLLLGIPSCKEIGPEINLHPNHNSLSDTTYVESPVATPEAKNVVLEEMTGVSCVNCPQGHTVISTLKTTYPNHVIAIGLHVNNSFDYPVPGLPNVNLQSTKTNDLGAYLVYLGFEPEGTVDRKLFAGGGGYLMMDKSYWTTSVGSELALIPSVNVLVNKTYDTVSRQLTIQVELHYTQADTATNELSIMLTESGIVTPQKDGALIDTFYVHKDVLRDIITYTTGDAITATIVAGTVVRKTYQTTLNAAWKPENMSIVAFVHQQSGKVIYQGKEIGVMP